MLITASCSPSQGAGARRVTVLVRLLLTLLVSLAVVTLLSRVVTLKAYCRLKGIVELADAGNRYVRTCLPFHLGEGNVERQAEEHNVNVCLSCFIIWCFYATGTRGSIAQA